MSNVIEFLIRGKSDFAAAFKGAENGINTLQSAFAKLQRVLVTGAVVQFGRDIIDAVDEAQHASVKLNTMLRNTEFAAGTTRTEIEKYVEALQKTSRFDDEALRNAATEILKFGYISKTAFKDALQVSVDYATFNKTQVPEAATMIARAMAAPEAASRLLRQAGIELTVQQKEQIKAFEEAGDKAKTQGLILDILKTKYSGIAVEMNTGPGAQAAKVNIAWGEMLETLGASTAVSSTIGGFIKFLKDSIVDLDRVIAERDILGKIKGIALFAAGFRGFTLPSDTAPKNRASGTIKYGAGQSPVEQAQAEAAAELKRQAAYAKKLEANKKAQTSAEELRKSIDDTSRSMLLHIQTFGLSAEQAKIYELRLRGVNEAQLSQLQTLADASDRQKQHADEQALEIELEKQKQQGFLDSIAIMEKAAATYSMTANQIHIYDAALGGASAAQVQLMLNAANITSALEAEAAKREKVSKLSGVDPLAEEQRQYEEKRAMALLYRELEATDKEQADAVIQELERSHQQALVQLAQRGLVSQQQFAKMDAALQIQVVGQKFKAIMGEAAAHNKAMFVLQKAMALAEAAIRFPQTVMDAYAWGTKFGGPFLGAAFAAIAGAAQLVQMKAIASASYGGGAAHGGLDYVPKEQTYLLDRGERVLSPRQNEDLTSFINGDGGGGGMVIQNLSIHILENATGADTFTRMDKVQLRNTLGKPIIDALNEMYRIGVRPNFAMQGK